MGARQSQDDRRAIKRKSAQARRVLSSHACKAGIDFTSNDRVDQAHSRNLMQREVDAGIMALEIFEITLNRASIDGGDHVADLKPPDFAACRLARDVLYLADEAEKTARAFEKSCAGI